MNRVCGPLRYEAGVHREESYRPERVVVLAHWSREATVSRSVSETSRQLSAHGYDVLISSSAECDGALVWPDGLPPRVSVFRRPNVGYDFGSWSQALERFPGVRAAPLAVLINDSLLGPFASIAEILERMESDSHPVWGLVSTSQDAPHLQSHFVAYRDGLLNTSQLRRFWSDVRVEPSKAAVIRRYEIGLAPVLAGMGVAVGAGFPWQSVVVAGGNPTSAGWRRLMLRGFPYVKRELVLRPPPEVPDTDDIPTVVRRLFDQDVWSWV